MSPPHPRQSGPTLPTSRRVPKHEACPERLALNGGESAACALNAAFSFQAGLLERTL